MYRPGRNEQNPADYISRHPQTTPARENAGEEYIAFLAKCGVPKAMTKDEVRSETQRIPLNKVIQKHIGDIYGYVNQLPKLI